MFNLTQLDILRFWTYIPKWSSIDECWNWLGYIGKNLINNDKRAKFSIQINGKQKLIYAYRIMYWLHYGEFNEELDVCHKCDNGKCVNPYHLFLGNNKNNSDDMVLKERNNNGKTKLTNEQIIFIKNNYKKYTNKELALMFNIDQSFVSRIGNNKRYKIIK